MPLDILEFFRFEHFSTIAKFSQVFPHTPPPQPKEIATLKITQKIEISLFEVVIFFRRAPLARVHSLAVPLSILAVEKPDLKVKQPHGNWLLIITVNILFRLLLRGDFGSNVKL